MRKTLTPEIPVKKKPFSKMTKAEKRMAIAEDALKWLSLGKIGAISGNYFDSPEVNTELEKLTGRKTLDLQEILEKEGTTCEVCAKGALFAADVLRRDNFRMGINNIYIGSLTIEQKLADIFDPLQLHLIEAAYEGVVVYGENEMPEILIKKSRAFYGKYSTSEARMIAIMKNIIKNKGEFKP